MFMVLVYSWLHAVWQQQVCTAVLDQYLSSGYPQHKTVYQQRKEATETDKPTGNTMRLRKSITFRQLALNTQSFVGFWSDNRHFPVPPPLFFSSMNPVNSWLWYSAKEDEQKYSEPLRSTAFR
jgi:hypothetical protein